MVRIQSFAFRNVTVHPNANLRKARSHKYLFLLWYLRVNLTFTPTLGSFKKCSLSFRYDCLLCKARYRY